MITDLTGIASALRVTKRAIELRANREAWPYEAEAVRGGRRKVFVLETLPAEVARAMKKHQAITTRAESSTHVMRVLADLEAKERAERAAKQAKGEQNIKKLMEPLAESVQARFDGRYSIVKSWERWFPTVQPMGKKASYWAYADAFNANDTDIAAAVREQFQPLKGRSVESWVLAHVKDGLAGLIDHWDGKAKKDVNVFTSNPKLEEITIALMIMRPHLSMKTLTEMLGQAAVDADTGEVLFAAPSYWATTRFCNAWKKKNDEFYLASTNPDEWKNKKMVAFGDAAEGIERLNQRWEMDATPADWMLRDDDDVRRRYSVSVIIDVYSERSLMVMSPTPRAETHKLALRLAILLWGVPEEIVTDNGADYVSRDFLNTLKMLDIAHHRTDPFSPWEKPYVERMNQTMLHSVLEVYSSFIGHNVAERNAIEARATFAERLFSKDTDLVEMAMPAQLLQTRINQWLTGVYEQRPHGGAHMDGLSPFAKAAAYRGQVHRIADERALDILLAPPAGKGSYVVVKKGLNIMGAQFIALELALIVGKTVQVYLTDDYGQIVVYHEGKFVCVARCPERTGISRQEIASHARQLQRKNIAEQRKAAKMPKLDPDALVSSYLQGKAEAAGKLVTLPAPAQTHTTTALTAAGRAARTLDGAVPTTEVPGDLQMIMNKRQAEREAPAAPSTPEPEKVSVIPETAQLRYRKWQELDELLKMGGTLDDPKLTRWYGTYPMHPEFAVMKRRDADTQARAALGLRDTAGTVSHFKTNN
jgi:transposase InsO family protein